MVNKNIKYNFSGDRPSPPGVPIIQYVKSNEYKVYWEASEDNGAPIEEYKLEGKVVRYYRLKRSTINRTAPFYLTSPSIEIQDEPEWEVFYNGTGEIYFFQRFVVHERFETCIDGSYADSSSDLLPLYCDVFYV